MFTFATCNKVDSTIERWKMDNYSLTHVSAYWTSYFLVVIIHKKSGKIRNREWNWLPSQHLKIGHFQCKLSCAFAIHMKTKKKPWKMCFVYRFIFIHKNSFSYFHIRVFARALVLKQMHKVNSEMTYSLLYQDNGPKLIISFLLIILLKLILIIVNK